MNENGPEWVNLIQMTIISTIVGQNPLEGMEQQALIVNKRVRNAVLACNLKNGRMTSFHFLGKPFNIMVIQVYAPTTNPEEAAVNDPMKTYKTF